MAHSICGSDCHSFQLIPYNGVMFTLDTYFSKNHFFIYNKAIGKHKQKYGGVQ